MLFVLLQAAAKEVVALQSMIATKQADLAQLMVEEEAVAKMVQEAKQGAATTPQGLFAKLASEKEQELLRVNRGE